jgi:hypothetical protein
MIYFTRDSEDSWVSKVTILWAGRPSSQGLIPERAHSATYSVDTGGSLFQRVSGLGAKLTTHLHLALRLRMRGAIPASPSCVFMAWRLIKHKASQLHACLLPQVGYRRFSYPSISPKQVYSSHFKTKDELVISIFCYHQYLYPSAGLGPRSWLVGDTRSQVHSIDVIINTRDETRRLMDWSGKWKSRGLAANRQAHASFHVWRGIFSCLALPPLSEIPHEWMNIQRSSNQQQ